MPRSSIEASTQHPRHCNWGWLKQDARKQRRGRGRRADRRATLQDIGHRAASAQTRPLCLGCSRRSSAAHFKTAGATRCWPAVPGQDVPGGSYRVMNLLERPSRSQQQRDTRETARNKRMTDETPAVHAVWCGRRWNRLLTKGARLTAFRRSALPPSRISVLLRLPSPPSPPRLAALLYLPLSAALAAPSPPFPSLLSSSRLLNSLHPAVSFPAPARQTPNVWCGSAAPQLVCSLASQVRGGLLAASGRLCLVSE